MSEEIEVIIQGYQKFKHQYYDKKDVAFNELIKNGQKPKVLVIACSDSRVDPAIIMNSQPGDLFVVRNVANLIPPYEQDNGYHGTSAALEFGVCVLGIKHIIVLGHSACGGMIQLIKNETNNSNDKDTSFINKWIELARPSYRQALNQCNHNNTPTEALAAECAQYSLINSLENLQTFPWVRERVQSKELLLHAWYFDLLTGSITSFSKERNAFIELEETYQVESYI
jgi:carbonic anhydrase